MKKNTLIKFAFLALVLLFAPLAVFGAQENSVVIVPSKIELNLQPNQKTKKTVMVINKTNQQVKLKIYAKDYRVDENGKIELYEEAPVNAVKWLIPQYKEITLMPLQSKAMQLIAAPLPDMSAGGHYGVIVFEPQTSSGLKKTGSLVLLSMNKEGISTGMKINNFKLSLFEDPNPINLDLNLKNLGNTHFSANGNIVFTNLLGNKIAQFELGQMLVYPESSRNFAFTWSQHPLMGVYKATISVQNPLDQGKTENAEKWFVVLPFVMWQSILTGILILLLIALITFFALRHKKAKKPKRRAISLYP